MSYKGAGAVRGTLVWVALLAVITVPICVAATSPLLAWREPIYIAAGFAGVIAMALLLVQPLLAGVYLPGLPSRQSRSIHRIVGVLLVAMVTIHVGGLWITSPPDVVDALLFVSPTPFSGWGFIAMWAVGISALVAALRRYFGRHLQVWRITHSALAAVIVVGSIVHALLIEGTMGSVSKMVLCVLVLAATVKAITGLRGS